MEQGGLVEALERSERALGRLERALAAQRATGRDEKLREKVREAVAELDQLIRTAGR